MLNCPKCNRIIIDSTNTGGFKLRSRMVLFEDGKAQALCPSCKTKVDVPLSLGELPDVPSKPKHILNVKNEY